MRLTIFMLSVVLSMTSAPALAEWSFIDASAEGDKWFIDLDTLKKGKTPRAWILRSSPQADEFGDISAKVLYEAKCAEEQIRILSLLTYNQPLGKGQVSSSSDKPSEWVYAPPGSIYGHVINTLCAKGNH